MAWHSSYWSNSKFATWLRGIDKPSAATAKGWREWHKESKAKHPFRYWLAEDALDDLQNLVTWPWRQIMEVKYHIKIGRAHV